MKQLIYILLLLCFNSANAQLDLDSLWAVWNDPEKPDTSRLKAINEYTRAGYLYTNPDSAFYFAQLQYDFAKHKGLKKHAAKARSTQGISFSILSNYNKALEYFSKSLKIEEEIGDRKNIASSLNNIGIIYYKQGNYAKAIENHTKSLKIKEEIGNQKGVAASLINIGNIYYAQGSYTKAMEYFTRSLKIEEKIGDQKRIASSLSNIGAIYKKLGNYTKAMKYFVRSLKIRNKISDQPGIAVSLINIGGIYEERNNNVEAMNYFVKSLKIQEKIGFQQGIATSLISIGNIYEKKGDNTKALDYSVKALNIALKIGAASEIKNSAHTLWGVNKKLGRYKTALEMYELYIATQDSIQSEENKREVILQEYKYEYEKQASIDSVAHAKQQQLANATISQQKAEAKVTQNQQYALYLGLFLVLVFAGFMYNRFKKTQKQKQIIEAQKAITEQQKNIVEEKNKEISDSITYAKRIQEAILPSRFSLSENLTNGFVLFKPKDIVSGDFYWLEKVGNATYFAAADCTGHGVPGAMVSVVCANALSKALLEENITETGKLLDRTRELVVERFAGSGEDVKDGMDISLCKLKGNKLQWSGANNPLWIIRNSLVSTTLNEQSNNNQEVTELVEVKPDKQPIGKTDNALPFTTHNIKLQQSDSIYIFTDGYADQFGGEKGKKFKYKSLKELLLSVQDKTLEEQKTTLNNSFENWKGDLEQVDDVCVIGVRL